MPLLTYNISMNNKFHFHVTILCKKGSIIKQPAWLLYFDYSPLGYANRIFCSPIEI